MTHDPAIQPPGASKWPNVPACYDWLSLDRRGDWRLQGERVTHGGLIQFINLQYGCDESGCWFMQNGPQRVFVSLAYTPWIFRHQGDGFVSHTGLPGGKFKAIYLDEQGNLLLDCELGIGLLDDRDLAAFLAECRDAKSRPATEAALLALMDGEAQGIYWQGVPIEPIVAVDVPKRFNFQLHPQPMA